MSGTNTQFTSRAATAASCFMNGAGLTALSRPKTKGKNMKKQYLALSLGFVAVLAAAQASYAQGNNRCAERSKVIERLAGKFGESRQSIGMAANNSIVEMYASKETGTWTITVTHPNGITCMVAAGNAYEAVEEQLPASLGDPA
ncbi:MAG: hypothetical protein AAF672_11390 [Pseudomonadota bacterium]